MGFSYTFRCTIILYTPCVFDSNFALFIVLKTLNFLLFSFAWMPQCPRPVHINCSKKPSIVHTVFHTIYINFKCFRIHCIHTHTTLSITPIKLLAISTSQTVINSNNLNSFSKSQLSLFSNIL